MKTAIEYLREEVAYGTNPAITLDDAKAIVDLVDNLLSERELHLKMLQMASMSMESMQRKIDAKEAA